MSWPAIIMIGMFILALGMSIVNDGKSTKISFVHQFLATSINLGLLYWGGFFQ